MTIEKLTKQEREQCLEGLIRRATIAQQEGRDTDRRLYESKLLAEAERYEKDYGHKYRRQFKNYESSNLL